MASPNKGNVPSDPASTPFATRDGKPTTGPGIGKGTDFTRDPTGNGPRTGGGFVPQSRPQRDEVVEGPSGWAGGIPQQPIQDPGMRVNMAEAGYCGPGMVDGDGARARGATQGVAHNPMRLGTPSPGHPSNPSGSGTRPSSTSSASSASGTRETDRTPRHR